MNPLLLFLIFCVISSITVSVANLACSEKQKEMCGGIASLINLILCLIFLYMMATK